MAVKSFNEIFRDFETDGVPASGAHKPIKEDIRDSLEDLRSKGVAKAADRAAVKLLDVSKYTVVFLEENGREAWFEWNATVPIVTHQADTNEYTYIAPNAAAIGAFVRRSGAFVGRFPTPALRTIEEKLWDRPDLRDWIGVDVTDTNDNASILQAAVDQVASSNAGTLHLPAGKLALGSTVVLGETYIEGEGHGGGAYSSKPTWLHIGHLGKGLHINTNIGARGLRNLGTYRSQNAPGPGFVPIAADYDIFIEGGQDITIENFTMLNATRGINIVGKTAGAVACGRINLRNIKGQPMLEGIRATHCTDVLYLDEIHFWPLWNAQVETQAYVRNNGQGMILGRVDNPMLGRVFVFGYSRGMAMINQPAVGSLPTGNVGRLRCSTFDADNCGVAVQVAAGANGVTASFGVIDAASDPNPGGIIATEPFVWCQGQGALIDIGTLSGYYNNSAMVSCDDTGNIVTIARSESLGIDFDGGGTPEFNAAAGSRIDILSKPKTSSSVLFGGAGYMTIAGAIRATATWDPGSCPDNTSVSTTISVPGAVQGDPVSVALSSLLTGAWVMSANVTSANTVTVTLFNRTGGTVDLTAGTLRVMVHKTL